MQRPRRTSEFYEDPLAKCRQSRVQQRSTIAPSPAGGGTAKKYSNRQSRIAVPNRHSSADRVGSINNAYLSVPSSAVKRVGSNRPSSLDRVSSINNGFHSVPPTNAHRVVTPQKTPLKPSTNRVLFTAEKLRSGNGKPVALHNDKKWVHEQTQRITEHLLKQNTLGGGISTDFVNRGLKQMSIKQFVAIINYFLSFIWGNRYKVGNNHVEDIIDILQKLQYPLPVNKSWLKTPSTQHSFGNVIVLFDFLMDFVPASNGEGEYFDLKEPEVLSNSRVNDELFQIPDLDFQQELLKHSEEGFCLWDKQKDDEFDCLQQQTCNLLIQKMCGIPDLEGIDIEIQKCKDILKTLKKERPEYRGDLEMKVKLSTKLKNLRRHIDSLNEEFETNEMTLKDINSRKKIIVTQIETIEKEIKSLHEMLTQQKCTVEERDQLIAQVSHYKHMLAIKERTVQDLQERYHNQQIQLSRALKQFTDQVESFNNRMREIKYSDVIKSLNLKNEDLELSLRPAEMHIEHVAKIIPFLKNIQQKLQENTQKNKKDLNRIQQHYKQLTDDLDTKLHPKLNALRSANTSNMNSLQNLQQNLKQEELKLSTKIQELEKDLFQADNTIKDFNMFNNQKKSQVEELSQQNEQTMLQAEEKHKQAVQQRKSFLDAYDKMLDDCMQNDVLSQLLQQVEMQEKQFEEIRKELNNWKD